KMTDWGAHHNDIAQWGLGMDNSGPTQIQTVRATPPDRRPNCYNCPEHFEVSYTYVNGANGAAGTVLRCMNDGRNGIKLLGQDGNRWRSRPMRAPCDQEYRRLTTA